MTAPHLRRLLAAMARNYTQALSVQLLYKYSLLQSATSIAINLLGIVLFWISAGRHAGSSSGYSSGLIIAYFAMTFVHGVIQDDGLTSILGSVIRDGTLSASLLRPYHCLVSLMVDAAGVATIRCLTLFPILAIVIAGSEFAWGRDSQIELLRMLGLYLPALALSVVMGWLTRVVIGLLAFDMVDIWGPSYVFDALYVVGSGSLYPPDLLPEHLAKVIHWTPLYYMVGFPSLVFLGRIHFSDAVELLMQGCVVALVMVTILVLMWRRGIQRFEAIGI